MNRKSIIPIVYLFCIVAFLTTPALSSDYTALSGGNVLEMKSGKWIENAIVLIKDNEIIDVGKKVKKFPDDATVIDISGKYIIPGLVDAHIHFFQSGGLYTRPDGLDLRHRVPYEDKELKWIRENFQDVFTRYIRCGITSVVDLGGPMWNFDVRKEAENSDIAPRVFITGPLIASYQPDALTTDDPPIIKVNNAQEALDLVRKQAASNPDFIKVWYVAGKGAAMPVPEFYHILEAIVEESHRLGYPVYVHALELETAKYALRAGTDVLVHSVRDSLIDDEFIELAKSRKNPVYIIPTMWVFNSYSAVYSKQLDLMTVEHLLGNPYIIGTFFDMYELKYDELGERQKKLLIEKKSYNSPSEVLQKNLLSYSKDAGMTVVSGTDAGNVGVIHGPSLFHEMEYMKMSGMENFDIIKASTLSAAEMLGRKDLGRVKAGHLADLVVLDENPVKDLSALQKIHLVLKDGKVFEPQQTLPYSPQDLAQIQINAYNERDIESFLEVYADDVEIYMFPDSLLYKGKDKMRQVYEPYFQKAVGLHCDLVNRIKMGKYIMDREFVTGHPSGKDINAVAIYECENMLIKKVWFLK